MSRHHSNQMSLKSKVTLSLTQLHWQRARAAKKERVPPTASVETKYLGWIRSHTIWPSSETSSDRLHLFTGPIYSGWPPDLNLKSLNRKEVAPMPGWEGDQGKKSTEKMLLWDQGNVDMGGSIFLISRLGIWKLSKDPEAATLGQPRPQPTIKSLMLYQLSWPARL